MDLEVKKNILKTKLEYNEQTTDNIYIPSIKFESSDPALSAPLFAGVSGDVLVKSFNIGYQRDKIGTDMPEL